MHFWRTPLLLTVLSQITEALGIVKGIIVIGTYMSYISDEHSYYSEVFKSALKSMIMEV